MPEGELQEKTAPDGTELGLTIMIDHNTGDEAEGVSSLTSTTSTIQTSEPALPAASDDPNESEDSVILDAIKDDTSFHKRNLKTRYPQLSSERRESLWRAVILHRSAKYRRTKYRQDSEWRGKLIKNARKFRTKKEGTGNEEDDGFDLSDQNMTGTASSSSVTLDNSLPLSTAQKSEHRPQPLPSQSSTNDDIGTPRFPDVPSSCPAAAARINYRPSNEQIVFPDFDTILSGIQAENEAARERRESGSPELSETNRPSGQERQDQPERPKDRVLTRPSFLTVCPAIMEIVTSQMA